MSASRHIRINGDVAYVPLTKGYEAVIDAADVPLVDGWSWYAHVFKSGRVYACRTLAADGKRRAIGMHRQIAQPPADLLVDHRDNDGLNNRRSNLRVCTGRQNAANSAVPASNQLGIKGVRKAKNRYRAVIKVGGRYRHLGNFATAEEAALAFQEAARGEYGEYAWEGGKRYSAPA